MKFYSIECSDVHDDATEDDREYAGTDQRNTGLCTDTANGVAQRNQPVLGKDLFESQGTQSLEIACETKAQDDTAQCWAVAKRLLADFAPNPTVSNSNAKRF